MTSNSTVAIIYGFAEGNYHGRRLRRALKQSGFTPIKDVQKADVIIAHSAGCYLLPGKYRAHTVLHIGYTYWPGRRLVDSLRENQRQEYRQHGIVTWLKDCLVNNMYMLNIAQTVRMYRGWHDPGAMLDVITPGRHIFIRNHHDAYCEPQQLMSRAGTNHVYMSLPGTHNHIWDTPEPYVNLLKSMI